MTSVKVAAFLTLTIVLLEYRESGKAEHHKEFLRDWQGYLHTDGYTGYHSHLANRPIKRNHYIIWKTGRIASIVFCYKCCGNFP